MINVFAILQEALGSYLFLDELKYFVSLGLFYSESHSPKDSNRQDGFNRLAFGKVMQ